jgi:putative transposase
MIGTIICAWKRLASHLSQQVKRWTQPLTTDLVASTLSDLSRTRADLVAENALLRHQLTILRRQVKRPQLTHADRFALVLLARCARFWQ